jgi:dihydroorotate dehydrogenase electron transfer subunit
MDIPQYVKIKKIVEENPKVKTFFLDTKIDAKPGQFLMVYVKDIDEKPFSFSSVGNEIAITVEKKGEFTTVMFALKAGDKVGIRGPYGNGFSNKENALFVAGGLGLAPLTPLIKQIKDPTVIYGAKTKELFIFKNQIKNYHICTDDGSAGKKGFTTELLKELIKKKKYDIVYACGPEVMMKGVFDICEKENIPCELSLERYMKCGFGLCGQCAIDDMCVCKDGPIFSSEKIRKFTEFGKFARLKSGKLVELKEYYK